MPIWMLLAFLSLSIGLSAITLYINYLLQRKHRAKCLIVWEPEVASIRVNGKLYKSSSPLMLPTKIGEKLGIEVSQEGYASHQANFIVRSAQSFYYCQLKRENHLKVLNNPSPLPQSSPRKPNLRLVQSQIS